jgi:DNA polymerase-3 subunit epsilon
VPELSDLDVLIVDCQATGASPAFGEVLELGWCLTSPARPELGDLQSHWITLPPGHVVPRQVRLLTGFDGDCASGALAASDAWNRLCASMRSAHPMPAAIHYARFELSFLRDWSRRFAPDSEFPIDAVCVHALALRLYPGLPRRSLRALAGHLGFGLDLARRSLGHVEATAYIWRRLCADLAERGVRTWEQLHDFIVLPQPALARSPKRRYPMPRERYRALPDAPGVYHFLRSNGDVLYVGKAASLKKRVASHFTARSSREHSVEMLTQASDVRFLVAPSALEAALLENETIKALRPTYNVQLVPRDPRAWFANATFDAAVVAPDASHPKGPLPSEFSLRSLGALLPILCEASPGVIAAPSRANRAWAVGATDYWAPDPEVFAAGLTLFIERHLAPIATPPYTRAALFASVKRSIESGSTPKLDEEPDVTAAAEPSAPVWDPERVARHLERALVQAYQLLRRSRWLCLLYESAVVFREPGARTARLLIVHRGELVDAIDTVDAADVTVTPRPHVPLAERRRAFDRARYDRLRLLTTELKRILRDGGDVTVQFSATRRLSGSALASVLRWV